MYTPAISDEYSPSYSTSFLPHSLMIVAVTLGGSCEGVSCVMSVICEEGVVGGG